MWGNERISRYALRIESRPVIIIQNDIGNKYAQTAIIVPLTKIIANKVKQPTHCIISPTDNLKHYSVALTEQIRVIDKSRLKTKIGRLNDTQIKDLDKAIITALNLKGWSMFIIKSYIRK